MPKRAITVTGAGEAAADLRDLAGLVSDLSSPARAGADLIAADARRRAPVASGRLRASIRVADVTPAGARVTIGARYARPVLDRRNFLTAAADAKETAAAALIENDISSMIRRKGF